jgi:inorganic triphosphatase YgiF
MVACVLDVLQVETQAVTTLNLDADRPTEIEATLVICSDSPKRVLQELSSLNSLAGFGLVHLEPILMGDTYFDTASADLGSRMIALRLRTVDDQAWIALKGPESLTAWGGVERLELESAWSIRALSVLLSELDSIGLATEVPSSLPDDLPPSEAVTSAGFVIVQERGTRRIVRNVTLPNDDPGNIIAELVIDSVRYKIREDVVCHYEIEIEAKSSEAEESIQAMMEELIGSFDSQIRLWKHGKLATGKALEKMADEGLLTGLVNSSRDLLPVAYDKIDGYLQKYPI